MTDQDITQAVTIGSLTYACSEALKLLTDPDSTGFDADKVEKLLTEVLKGVNYGH
jgi:hypothetical protein